MVESASQLLHRKCMDGKSVDVARDVAPFHCWVCGAKAERGQERWKWAGTNYTGQSKARCPPSDYVCESCIVVMAGRPPDTERMYSHFVEGASWLRVNKGQKPAMREFLRRPKGEPWFAAIADSGQKHIVPWCPVNAPGVRGFAIFEEALVELPDGDGWRLVDDIADMLTGGATKEEILPGAWGARAYSLLGERIEEFEAQWGSLRGGSWFDLAVWLAQRDEAKVAERMAAEKVAAAEKKAKAKTKEVGGGTRKVGKGKATNAHGGDDPRPAKRVPADAGVQRAEALGPAVGPGEGEREDVGDAGAVVHGDAPRLAVVESKQGQFVFLF